MKKSNEKYVAQILEKVYHEFDKDGNNVFSQR